jgi:hypothetical protein
MMRSLKSIIILFNLLIIFSIIIPYSNAEDLENQEVPTISPKLQSELNYYKQIYDSQKNPQSLKSASTVSSEDIYGGVDNTISFSSPDSPIKIKKVFSPGNKTNYLLGDPIGVYVEISSTDEDLTDIAVLEVIDDELCVSNVSNGYGKISSIDAFCEYYRDLNSDAFLQSESCINKNSACRILPLNKSGVSLKKDEQEYNLLNFNMSNSPNRTEFSNMLRVFNIDFNILFMEKNSYYNKTYNKIRAEKVDDIDFVEITIGTDNNSAKVNINNDRNYELKAQKAGNSIRINETEVALKFKIDRLLKRDTFIYKYYIKPKKPGIFNTVTLVRSWGRSDTKSVSSIDVKEPNPLFDIIPRPKDLIKIRSWPLNQTFELVYDITYLGGASEPELHNTKIKLENDMDYYSGSFDNGDFIKTINFTKYKTEHIHTNIRFKENGLIPVPVIYINDKLYNFKDTSITVYGLFGWLASLINFYNVLITMLIAFLVLMIVIASETTPEKYIINKKRVLKVLIDRIRNVETKGTPDEKEGYKQMNLLDFK